MRARCTLYLVCSILTLSLTAWSETKLSIENTGKKRFYVAVYHEYPFLHNASRHSFRLLSTMDAEATQKGAENDWTTGWAISGWFEIGPGRTSLVLSHNHGADYRTGTVKLAFLRPGDGYVWLPLESQDMFPVDPGQFSREQDPLRADDPWGSVKVVPPGWDLVPAAYVKDLAMDTHLTLSANVDDDKIWVPIPFFDKAGKLRDIDLTSLIEPGSGTELFFANMDAHYQATKAWVDAKFVVSGTSYEDFKVTDQELFKSGGTFDSANLRGAARLVETAGKHKQTRVHANVGKPDAGAVLRRMGEFIGLSVVSPSTYRLSVSEEKQIWDAFIDYLTSVGNDEMMVIAKRRKGAYDLMAQGQALASTDIEQAYILFVKASELGLVQALYLVAECKLYGKGVEADPQAAVKLLAEAAEKEESRAQNLLGVLYQKGAHGVEQNFKEALRLFDAAVALKLADAYANRGVMYMNGQGVEKDPKRGFADFEKAAEQGSVQGMTLLAKCYEAGIGCAKSPVMAAAWSEDARKLKKANATKK